METIYKYAIMRASPDARRGEVVNIGVVVFHAQTVDVLFPPSFHKLLALDGTLNLDEITQLPDTIKLWASRFDSVQQKHNAINKFGIISLSELGQFRVDDSLSYARQTQRLMQTFVIARPRVSTVTANNRITTDLRTIFIKKSILGFEQEDIKRHLVVQRYPIDEGENLYSDFAFKNGVYWFTETVDFRARTKGPIDQFRAASFAAVKLDKAKKKHRKAKTFVVYAQNQELSAPSALTLLGDYADEVINIDNKHEISRYTNSILNVAGSNHSLIH
jgi:Protein of unknown function (DUF3037)